jgi:hypothetical protein
MNAGTDPPVARGKLFRRYFVLVLALVTSAVLVTSAIGLYFSYRETLAALDSLQREKAYAAADRIRTYVETIQATRAASSAASSS